MPPSQTVDKLVLGFVSQSQFSFINQIAFKIKFVKWAAPHFAFILASFFRFMAANLSFTQFVTWAKPLYLPEKAHHSRNKGMSK